MDVISASELASPPEGVERREGLGDRGWDRETDQREIGSREEREPRNEQRDRDENGRADGHREHEPPPIGTLLERDDAGRGVRHREERRRGGEEQRSRD